MTAGLWAAIGLAVFGLALLVAGARLLNATPEQRWASFAMRRARRYGAFADGHVEILPPRFGVRWRRLWLVRVRGCDWELVRGPALRRSLIDYQRRRLLALAQDGERPRPRPKDRPLVNAAELRDP